MDQDRKLFDGLKIGASLLLFALFGGQPLILGAQVRPLPQLPKSSAQSPSRRTLASETDRDRGRRGHARVDTTSGAGVNGVTLQDNLLSLDIHDESLRTIIERIATQGGIDVRHLQETPDTHVSIRFTAMPLVDGLKRLFRVADLPGYLLVAEGPGEQARVQQILFLPVEPDTSRRTTRVAPRPSPVRSAPPRRPPPRQQVDQDEEKSDKRDGEESQSVFDVIKSNTTARRLLSQLVHPNAQVRERALERLVRLVGDDAKQAELLEFLEPLMDDLASEDRTVREEARTEVRKLLRR